MIMKKEYLNPDTHLIPIYGVGVSLCASTNELTNLDEKDDLEGFEWNYNNN